METSNEFHPALLIHNPLYAGITVGIVLFILALVILIGCILKSKKSKTNNGRGYKPGRRITNDGKGPPDLWINHYNESNLRTPGMHFKCYCTTTVFFEFGIALCFFKY